MHELGLCEGIVEAVLRRAHGRPVAAARARVGGHAMDPAVIAQGVAVAALGTEVEGMRLEVVVDPLRSRCGACGAEQTVEDPVALVACRRCGGVDVEVLGSELCLLESVVYRVGDTSGGRMDGRIGA
ncbi:MAG: hydrogenase/urease maturation nickel metallochaperone HypA [Acidimicrobiales bacterium]